MTSEYSPVSRGLHRAAGLLTTKGEPVPAIADTILASDFTLDHESLRRRRTDGGGLGGSIKRKLHQVRDAGTNVARRASFKRHAPAVPPPPPLLESASEPLPESSSETSSRYLSPPSTSFTLSPVVWVQRRQSHRRAQSESLSTRPRVGHDHNTSPSADSPFLSPPPTPLTRMASLPESPIVEQPSEPVFPVAQPSSSVDATVPPLLQVGVPMIKVSAKKQKRYFFRLDADQGQIIWQSKKLRFSECPVPIADPPILTDRRV